MIGSRPVMGRLYRCAARPLLFRLDPERAHRLAFLLLPFLPDRPPPTSPILATKVAGLSFDNPVGLAAGYDKDGRHARLLARLGFAHVEVGTLTPRAQAGNPKPRLFRIPEREALLNRMGFNNPGAPEAAHALALLAAEGGRLRIGASIGKQRETPIEGAVEDYRAAAAPLAPVADYLVVNISSPNTPGLRALESGDLLAPLVRAVRAAAEESARRAGRKAPPVFVKLSPDLAPEALERAAEAASGAGARGLVLSNTTTDPALLETLGLGAGGVSGRPLAARALEALRLARRATRGEVALVASGGIFDGDDAYRRIRAGASLVQVYTALVYRGPSLVPSLLKRLERLLARDGFANVAEAVGADA